MQRDALIGELQMEGERLPKRLLSVEEAAFYLGLSARTIYNQISPKSKVPFPVKALKIGKLRKFDIRDLDKFIQEAKKE